jgi:hypothetical protein
MIFKKLLTVVSFILLGASAFSQGFVESGLYSNAKVEARSSRPWKIKNADTLQLPFLDDFSKSEIYPDSTLWKDNYVFVNREFGLNPPTFGVATFDMLDNKGIIYENATSDGFYADTLTSLPINTDYPGDTTVILSFWYQPQGVANNAPETGDSLMLQFYSPVTEEWYKVWSAAGSAVYDFKPVYIRLDSIFLANGFQFRFINKASIGDNTIPSWASDGDYWNLDMVYLDRNRSLSDSLIDDVAITSNFDSPINDYQSIPWKHFDASVSLITSQDDPDFRVLAPVKYCDLGVDSANIGRYFQVKDLLRDTIVYPTADLGSENMFLNDCVELQPFYQGNVFPQNGRDSGEFEIKFYIKYDTTGGLRYLYRYNDTIRRIQRFYDYYAYDDGSAESGAGIYGVGTSHAFLAYKFKVLKGDTLRAMKVFFNRTNTEANRKYFILTIWDDNNGAPGNIIYQQTGYRPEFHDSLNAFITYKLDTAIYIDSAETFYIGWERTTEDFLNVGFDKNHDASDKIFFNINGYWENSPLSGALMIRPVFSREPYVGIDEPIYNNVVEAKIYPNPAKNFVKVKTNTASKVKILNLEGVTIYESSYTKIFHFIDLHNYSSGIYFIVIEDGRGNKQIRKLIKY